VIAAIDVSSALHALAVYARGMSFFATKLYLMIPAINARPREVTPGCLRSYDKLPFIMRALVGVPPLPAKIILQQSPNIPNEVKIWWTCWP